VHKRFHAPKVRRTALWYIGRQTEPGYRNWLTIIPGMYGSYTERPTVSHP